MRIAHFSDTHLGHTRFSRVGPGGVNQRELDVLRSFGEALDQMLVADPDIVVHAGDFFDNVRPTNYSVFHAFDRISKFQASRGGKPFYIIGGNHDTPRTTGAGHVLDLFGLIPGVTVASTRAESVLDPDLDLEVLMVPNKALGEAERVSLTPNTQAAHRVLLLHGLAKGLVTDTPGEFNPEELRSDRWSYVALGDYHSWIGFGNSDYPANAGYSGSTDHTSTNPWDELGTPKGWTLYDTATGKASNQVLTRHRRLIGLPSIDAATMTVGDLEDALRATVDWNPEDQPIVRLVVRNVHSEVRKALNRDVLQELEKAALDFRVVFNTLAESTAVTAEGEGRPVLTLEDQWKAHVETVQVPFGVSQEEVIGAGHGLLKEASDAIDSTEA